MYSPTSFVIQIAPICIEVCGFNDNDSAYLNDLKRIFGQHEVGGDTKALHRVVVCASKQFEIPPEATLQWVSTCIGVAGPKPRRRPFFIRRKEVPQYSGTGDVACYKEKTHNVDYYIPENAGWRIKHIAEEHVTYVYSDGQNELSNGLPSMLIHVIGSQYGCYLLYASCIAVDGEALLFTGNSGVGKSTLCMELIRQGATYMGDDLVLVYMNGAKAMVGSLLFPVKCYADKMHTHKKTIDVASQTSQRLPLNLPLKSMFFLQRSDTHKADPHLEPVDGETVFETMLKLTNKAHINADGGHFVDTLSSICCSVPCYSLFYGDCHKITPSFFANNDRR